MKKENSLILKPKENKFRIFIRISKLTCCFLQTFYFPTNIQTTSKQTKINLSENELMINLKIL